MILLSLCNEPHIVVKFSHLYPSALLDMSYFEGVVYFIKSGKVALKVAQRAIISAIINRVVMYI